MQLHHDPQTLKQDIREHGFSLLSVLCSFLEAHSHSYHSTDKVVDRGNGLDNFKLAMTKGWEELSSHRHFVTWVWSSPRGSRINLHLVFQIKYGAWIYSVDTIYFCFLSERMYVAPVVLRSPKWMWTANILCMAVIFNMWR